MVNAWSDTDETQMILPEGIWDVDIRKLSLENTVKGASAIKAMISPTL